MGTKFRSAPTKPAATRPTPPSNKFYDDDDDELLGSVLDNLPALSTVKPQILKPINDYFNDDDDDSIMMLQLESEILKNSEKLDNSTKTNRNQSFPDENEMMEFQETPDWRARDTEPQFDDDDDDEDMLAQLDSVDPVVTNPSTSTSSSYFTSHSTPSPTAASSKFDRLKKTLDIPPKKPRLELPENEEIFEPPKERICDLEYPYKIGNANFVTIDQYLELIYEEKKDKILIFYASVKKYWKPLRLKNDEWILGCTIEDDYSDGELNVNMNSEMMGKLAGVDAKEFIRMKLQAASKPQLLLDIEKVSSCFLFFLLIF